MQESNFEKQVQQKLDELKVNPSAEVWTKVAARIKKDKRDWKLVYMFSVLLLAIVSGTLIWWNIKHEKQLTGASVKVNHKPGKPGPARSNQGDEHTAQSNLNDSPVNNQQGIATNNQGNQVTVAINPSGLSASTQGTKLSQPGKKIGPTTASNLFKQNKVTGERAAKASITFKSPLPHELNATDSAAGNNNDEINTINKQSAIIVPLTVDSTGLNAHNEIVAPGPDSNELKEPLAITKTPGEADSIIAKTNTTKTLRQKEPSKWLFGLDLSGGLSNTRTGYLGIAGSSQVRESYDYTQSPANGSGGVGNAAGSQLSRVKAGKAFMIGVYTQKQLSLKVSFLAAIDYKYYSTKMELGDRVDSVINFLDANFYYRGGNLQTFRNQYHFIELPVGVSFRLTKQDKWPVYLYTGITLSQLIKTTALQFEPTSGAYYNDNGLFNKTQADLSARILFSLAKKNQKNGFLIGPRLNYSLTKIAGAGLYKPRHYGFFGIHIQKGISLK